MTLVVIQGWYNCNKKGEASHSQGQKVKNTLNKETTQLHIKIYKLGRKYFYKFLEVNLANYLSISSYFPSNAGQEFPFSRN